jgi:hypothetical protein
MRGARATFFDVAVVGPDSNQKKRSQHLYGKDIFYCSRILLRILG